jgi:YD repeat-containing protein
VHSGTDALGNVTSTTYDFTSKEITTTAAYGPALAATTTQHLDAADNVTSVDDPLGHTTTYTLNAVYAVHSEGGAARGH